MLQKYFNDQGMLDFQSFKNDLFGELQTPNYPPLGFHYYEDTQKYELRVIVAGFDKKDIYIKVKNGITHNSTLVIESNRKKKNQERKKVVIENRICEKNFQVLVPFPKSIDVDTINAELNKGILTITLSLIGENNQDKLIKINDENDE